ncbi:hypothetical protein IHE44_0013833, partial [Lamprotornis superbus]
GPSEEAENLHAAITFFIHCPDIKCLCDQFCSSPLTAEDDDGQDDEDGKHPDTQIDHLSHSGPAVPGRLDGVHHSDVTVHTEHGQAVDAGEHVDGIHTEHQAAEQGAKGPVVQQRGGNQKGDAKHQQLIRDGQVEDVDVGGRLHLGIT